MEAQIRKHSGSSVPHVPFGDQWQALGMAPVDLNTLSANQVASIGLFLHASHDLIEEHKVYHGAHFAAVINYMPGYVMGLSANYAFFDMAIKHFAEAQEDFKEAYTELMLLLCAPSAPPGGP